MELEVALILIEHAVEPRQKLLSAVVGVQNDWDAVGRSNAADVVGSGDSAGNRGLLAIVADTLETKSEACFPSLATSIYGLGHQPCQQSKRHHPERPAR